MTVTEVALLRLSPQFNINDVDIRAKLANAKAIMQDYTGRTFYYLQQIEDPTYIYILGEWASLGQHMDDFIPGPDNQVVLEGLKDLLSVEWLLHINAQHTELPLPESDAELLRARAGGLVYGVVRHFVKDGQKDRFQEAFDAEKVHLQDFVTEGKIGGGWRVDKVDDRDEWVLVTPWTGVEQHCAFAETDGFAEYGKIREYIDGAEIKHARILDI